MRRKRSSFGFVIMLISVVALLGACTDEGPAATPDPTEEAILTRLNELDQRRQARERELAAMDVQELAKQLEEESLRGVEPFNSMPYEEMLRRGKKAAPVLLEVLNSPDRSSILGMLALRQIDRELYGQLGDSFRTEVLVDTLRTSETFNIWGLPHLYWEDAADALINEGRAALEALRPLLEDKRPAPMWGSEEVLEYQEYSYRVADYAWALSMEIRSEQFEIPVSPEARDRLIEEMSG